MTDADDGQYVSFKVGHPTGRYTQVPGFGGSQIYSYSGDSYRVRRPETGSDIVEAHCSECDVLVRVRVSSARRVLGARWLGIAMAAAGPTIIFVLIGLLDNNGDPENSPLTQSVLTGGASVIAAMVGLNTFFAGMHLTGDDRVRLHSRSESSGHSVQTD